MPRDLPAEVGDVAAHGGGDRVVVHGLERRNRGGSHLLSEGGAGGYQHILPPNVDNAPSSVEAAAAGCISVEGDHVHCDLKLYGGRRRPRVSGDAIGLELVGENLRQYGGEVLLQASAPAVELLDLQLVVAC